MKRKLWKMAPREATKNAPHPTSARKLRRLIARVSSNSRPAPTTRNSYRSIVDGITIIGGRRRTARGYRGGWKVQTVNAKRRGQIETVDDSLAGGLDSVQ